MTEQELARDAARRLGVIRHAREVTGEVAKTCRNYGTRLEAFEPDRVDDLVLVSDGRRVVRQIGAADLTFEP